MADSSCHTNNKTKTVTTSSSSNNNNAKEMGIGKREKNGASYFGFEQVTQMQSNGKRMANNNLSSVSFYHRYCCCCWNFTWHTFPTTFSNLPLIHSSPRTFYVKKKWCATLNNRFNALLLRLDNFNAIPKSVFEALQHHQHTKTLIQQIFPLKSFTHFFARLARWCFRGVVVCCGICCCFCFVYFRFVGWAAESVGKTAQMMMMMKLIMGSWSFRK